MSGSKPNPIPGGDKQRKIRRRSMVHSPPHQSNRSNPSSFLWSSSSTPDPLLPEQGFPSRPFASSPISSSVKRRRRKRRREKGAFFCRFLLVFRCFLPICCPCLPPVDRCLPDWCLMELRKGSSWNLVAFFLLRWLFRVIARSVLANFLSFGGRSVVVCLTFEVRRLNAWLTGFLLIWAWSLSLWGAVHPFPTSRLVREI